MILVLFPDSSVGLVGDPAARFLEYLDDQDQQDDHDEHDLAVAPVVTVVDGDGPETAAAHDARHG